ncbi:uncharacterized protein LOC113068416 isoform X2 [Carassius auratus]|uniref:Uncharacterized protein LOC113068416 isoform X2 n=1 Tax=Carassius auratus TaxID=7957 RepID=A0A6P6MKG9_CARAU|nr:uncharacterized protein LOC113068416 isoform X2 [Carassius auratus]
MGRTCCVVGCKVRSHDRRGKKLDNGLSFYCFPAWKQNEGSRVSDVTKRRRMAWISAIRRTDIHFADIPRSLKVCSRHFHSGKPAYEMDESHPDWAPALHLGHSEVTATVSDRHARRQHRHHLRESEGGGHNDQNIMNEDEREDAEEEGYRDQAEAAVEEEEYRETTETDQLAAKRLRVECQFCEQSSAEVTRLLQENRELRSELNKLNMDEEFFKDNTEKVRYYTGLPCFAILFSMFTTVKPFLPVAKKRAQSFSHYKGTHTMKYLIGITPQGLISFISKGWGGRASDKHITENCGLLNKLLPGDVVLADRGFNIKDSVGMMCAEVKIPAFTKRRCQLDAKDVEDTRAIAHLRIHVERVIGSLRNKYTLLHNTIPISLLLPCKDEEFTLLDKMVNVCCILVNMCPSVVVRPDETEKCAC